MRSLISKLLYALTEVSINAVETFIRLHLLVFYAKNVQLPTSWVGIAISISILWDAAIDPLIGRLSDDFKNKHGTRLHLVLIGAMATAISLSALFHPPTFETDSGKWFYLLMLSLCFSTSSTLLSVPYLAMAGDYTKERQERSRFIGWRTAFSNLGSVLGVLVPGYFLAKGDDAAYGNASWVLVMIVLSLTFLTSLAPPPLEKESGMGKGLRTRGDRSRFHPLRQVLLDRSFLSLLGAYFAVNLGLALYLAMALYFYRLRLQFQEVDLQNILLTFFLVFSLAIPLWIFISRKLGRKLAFIVGSLLVSALFAFAIPQLEVGQTEAALIWASILGGLFVACTVLLDSSLTDVVDFDHLENGQERLGLHFGVWKFSAKLSRALALFLAGFLLEWANVAFPDIDTSSRLATIMGPGVGVFFLAASAFLAFYPLTEKKCAQVKVALEELTLEQSRLSNSRAIDFPIQAK